MLAIESMTESRMYGSPRRYKEELRIQYPGWDVRALYVSTHNVSTHDEARHRRPEAANGVLYRGDILRILHRTPETENTIIEEFRGHLLAISLDTDSFRTQSVSSWSLHSWEGFFMELEKQLPVRVMDDDDYVGFHVDWSFCSSPSENLRLDICWMSGPGSRYRFRYSCLVEMDSSVCGEARLIPTVFVTARHFVGPSGALLQPAQLILQRYLSALHMSDPGPIFAGLKLSGVSRMPSGCSAEVARARLSSGLNNAAFPITDADGLVDLSATIDGLKSAMELLITVVNMPGGQK